MAPILVLLAGFGGARLAGLAGFSPLDDGPAALRVGLAAMFLVAAAAHWGEARRDLERMVPLVFPRPDAVVTLAGTLEIAGAIGLLVPSTARAAAACLALLLVAMFPADVHAAREGITILGRKPPPLPVRALLQAVFVVALVAAGFAPGGRS